MAKRNDYEKNDTKRAAISDTLVISAIPAIAYGVAFFFERGYLAEFGLPDFIITVSIERFFFALSVLVGALIVLINVLDFIFELIPEKSKLNWRLLLFAVFLSAYPLLAIYLFFSSHLTWPVALLGIIGVLGIFFVYVLPYLEAENFTDYLAKLEETDKRDRERSAKSLTAQMAHKIGPNLYITVLLILLLIPFVSGFFGSLTALRQTKYLATEINGKEYALLRIYDDLFVYAGASRIWVNLYQYKYVFDNSYIIQESKNSDVTFFPRVSVKD